MSNTENEKTRPKVILTCFAGRRRNMELLLLYTDRLHSMGLLDEVHIWDFSRDERDSRWLSRTFQPAPALCCSSYDYRDTGVLISAGETARLSLRCNRDAHVLLTAPDGGEVAEVSLGAYNNSCSFLRGRRQGETISARGGPMCDGNVWRAVEVSVGEDGWAKVAVDGRTELEGGLPAAAEFPLKVSLAGWGANDEVRWMHSDEPQKGRMHPYARLFHVRNKGSWTEYYRHYTSSLYPDHVIIKSDDDIVFVDVDSFGRFVEQRVADDESILLFPNIVNNGLCAGHQHRKGYVESGLGDFSPESVMGRLWGDGKLCGAFHGSFVRNYDSWMAMSRGAEDLVPVALGSRVSINFFAIRSEDLFVYQMVGHDDERDITTEVTKKLRRQHRISMNLTVAHLAFYRQRETGLDEDAALGLYRRLAKGVLGSAAVRLA